MAIRMVLRILAVAVGAFPLACFAVADPDTTVTSAIGVLLYETSGNCIENYTHASSSTSRLLSCSANYRNRCAAPTLTHDATDLAALRAALVDLGTRMPDCAGDALNEVNFLDTLIAPAPLEPVRSGAATNSGASGTFTVAADCASLGLAVAPYVSSAFQRFAAPQELDALFEPSLHLYRRAGQPLCRAAIALTPEERNLGDAVRGGRIAMLAACESKPASLTIPDCPASLAATLQ